MCEIPNNVILADEFAELFDGFSIGSNDLTQLALGVDRDSELLAHLFDERDPGVKRLIRMVVDAAHRRGRTVGICGQAPSDYPRVRGVPRRDRHRLDVAQSRLARPGGRAAGDAGGPGLGQGSSRRKTDRFAASAATK